MSAEKFQSMVFLFIVTSAIFRLSYVGERLRWPLQNPDDGRKKELKG